MMVDVLPFNPLDKKNLGASVARALLSSEACPLDALSRFNGAGIYAIYYAGVHGAYADIAARNQVGKTVPIYVGKAVPAGARKGGGRGATGGKPLFDRLVEHAKSIEAARNLDLADFWCRYLVVDDIWIPLGESLLIARYAPVWNALVDGFGNHAPGKGRHAGMCPRWDVLHPGREWASRCMPRTETEADIQREVVAYLASATFPSSDQFIQQEG